MNAVKIIERREYIDSGSDYDTAVDMYSYRREQTSLTMEIDGVLYFLDRDFNETTHSSYEEDEENGNYGPGKIRTPEKDSSLIRYTLSATDGKLSITQAQGDRLFEQLKDLPEFEKAEINVPSGLGLQMAARRMEQQINKHAERAMSDPSM